MKRMYSHRRVTNAIGLNQFTQFPEEEQVLVLIVANAPRDARKTDVYSIEAILSPFSIKLSSNPSPRPTFKSQPFYFPLPSDFDLQQCDISLTLRGDGNDLAFAEITFDDENDEKSISEGEVITMNIEFKDQDKVFGQGHVTLFCVHNYPEPMHPLPYPGTLPFYSADLLDVYIGRLFDVGLSTSLIVKISHPAFGTAISKESQPDRGCFWGESKQLPGFRDRPISGKLQFDFYPSNKGDPSMSGEAILSLEIDTDHLYCDCVYNIDYEWDCGTQFTFSFCATSSEPRLPIFFDLNADILRVQLDLQMNSIPKKKLDLHVFLCDDYEDYCEKLKLSRVPFSTFPHYPACRICSDTTPIDRTYSLHSISVPPSEALIHQISDAPQTVELWLRKPQENRTIVFEIFEDISDETAGSQFDFVGHFRSDFEIRNESHYTVPFGDISHTLCEFESTSASGIQLHLLMRVSNAEKLQEVSNELRSMSAVAIGPFHSPPPSDPSLASYYSRSVKSRSVASSNGGRSRKKASISASIPTRSIVSERSPSPPCVFEAIADHPRVKNLLHELEDKQESLKCLGIEIIYLRKQLMTMQAEKETIMKEKKEILSEKDAIHSRFVQHVKSEKEQLKKLDSLSKEQLAILLKKHGKAHKIEKYKRKQLQAESENLQNRIEHLEGESNRLRSASVQQLLHIQQLQRERHQNLKWKKTAENQEKVILGLETVLKKLDISIRKSENPHLEEEMDEHQKEEMRRARDTLHEMEKKLDEKEKAIDKKNEVVLNLEYQLKQSEARKDALENELKQSAARFGKEIALLKLSQDAGEDFDVSDGSIDDDLSFDITSANSPSPSVGDS